MSIKDLPFVTVEQVVIVRQAAIELEQRAEAAEAKLRELEIRPKNLFNEDVYVMQTNALQICSQTSITPKQEEK